MKRYSGKKRIDINQKSFAFTHRYDQNKFYTEKNLTKANIFLTKINNRLILASLFFTAIFLVVAIKIIEVNLFNTNEQAIFNKSYTDARGNILDRNNNPLTANLRLANIGAYPDKITDKKKFIPLNYETNVRNAMLTFMHHWVCDTRLDAIRMVNLNELPQDVVDTKYLVL